MSSVETPSSDQDRSELFSRLLVVCLVVLGALIVGYLALGMPGMDHGGETSTSGSSGMDHSATGDMRVGVEEFASRMSDPNAVVINVHTPYVGGIEGTDLSIAYDRIDGDPRLPVGTDAEILLYCQTGRMSREAAEALMAAGYTNVVDLEGGMDAWRAAGRPIASG